MSDDLTPGSGNEPAVDPNNEPNPPAPSNPPAPDNKPSDIERLRQSKDDWKTKALENEKRLKEIEDAEAKRIEEEKKAREEFKDLYEAEKAKREAAEEQLQSANSKVSEIEKQQEAEIATLLESIPEDKRPPLDDNDPPVKRLRTLQYAQSLLDSKPKPPVGAGVNSDPNPTGEGRKEELLKAMKTRRLTDEENYELMELSE